MRRAGLPGTAWPQLCALPAATTKSDNSSKMPFAKKAEASFSNFAKRPKHAKVAPGHNLKGTTMKDLDIIEERDEMRVRLERDDSPEQPYDEGACPILQIATDYYGSGEATAFNMQAAIFEKPFDVFNRAFGGRRGLEAFERYLRIFHGTKSFSTYNLRITGQYGYIAFDTKAWLEEIGVTEDNPDIEPVDRASGSLDEVKAWAEGDVWGYIIEKEVFWTKTYHDENGDDLASVHLPTIESGQEWVEITDGSCWGFYGRDYAEQAAKEAFNEALEEL